MQPDNVFITGLKCLCIFPPNSLPILMFGHPAGAVIAELEVFRVAVGQPGSISLFGDDPLRHRQFAGHITAEEWVTEYKAGKGYVSFWNKLPRANHWLDALAGACAAGLICGVRVLPGAGAGASKKRKRARAGVAYTKRFQPRGRG